MTDAEAVPDGDPARTARDDRPASCRPVLVVAHTGRRDALLTANTVIEGLRGAGAVPVLIDSEYRDLHSDGCRMDRVAVLGDGGTGGDAVRVDELGLAMVIGGDGTILRAAEIVRDARVPLLGVNLGHVGFLAESEREDLGETIRRVVAGEYDVEERTALEVVVLRDGLEVASGWALNEAVVEKASRERMIEVVIEVDGDPLSAFGCDGVVMSTPTGSTAYAFSGGGPVVWPELDALLLVPLSAHALFARPLVTTSDAVLATTLQTRTSARGVLWCDGRRSVDLLPGDRVEVRRSSRTVPLARLRQGTFTGRLVRKFALPVDGWRGTGA